MQRVLIQNSTEIRDKIQRYFNKNEEARFIHRLHGILMLIDNPNNTCDSVGELFGNSPRTVSNWASLINESSDIESLRDSKRQGRPSRVTAEQLAEIKGVLQLPPETSGVTANIWDGKSLSWYIKKQYNAELGVRRCQDLFKELGFSLKRARPIVAKTDPAKKEISKKTS
jgi:transposase